MNNYKETTQPSTKTETETHYLIEDESGALTRVPEDNVDDWAAADRTLPLNKAEKALKDSILRSIFGSNP